MKMLTAHKVAIVNNVIERLKLVDDKSVGVLFAHSELIDNTLIIVSFGILSESSESTWNSLPSNVAICGAFTTDSQAEKAEESFNQLSIESFCSPLLLTNVKNGIESHILQNGVSKSVSFTTLSNVQFANTFTFCRTTAEFYINTERNNQSIKSSLEDIKKKVQSGNVAFLLLNQKLFLTEKSMSQGTGITGDHRVKDLINFQSDDSAEKQDILFIHMHLKQTKDLDLENAQSVAPLIRHVRRCFECVNIPIKVDVLALVHKNAKIGTLFGVFTKSFLHGLQLIETNLINEPDKISTPETFHFLPIQSNVYISAVYQKSSSDAYLRSQREQLHKSFGFALDQPLFRRSQCYKFAGERQSNAILTNPHNGLNSGVKGGQAYLVKGHYNYHHYMQDRFDDNGWGCAYRSLQTIVSWFRLQGYTEVQVPTHKQIQECLVKIGDKPSSFIGSRQWIGSTEVSFVLETLLGVTCKILTASSGEEVGTLGSELSYHFQTHGTPIMIGGGVLAHTIIGVDYNRSTGDIKFLILDPHYTGGEDLNIITGKGWVGWKDVKFWTKNAFYNLCLPLRPIGDI
ncbi:putative Ufm1-specific protease 2 [Frankliniella fusca]|uniref:Probable Ufm1-specific protease 2 n=1 Tax=Frankliniella fusca TaxID=407009 RepID=A0AAE1HEW1_9NEOP|nr:putative Ufm1-specific protease 2 [Frankliniella fusca]